MTQIQLAGLGLAWAAGSLAADGNWIAAGCLFWAGFMLTFGK